MDCLDSPKGHRTIARYSPQTEMVKGHRRFIKKGSKKKNKLEELLAKIFSCRCAVVKSPKRQFLTSG